MKIAHLTIARELTAGQRKQLASEYEAARDIPEVLWTTVAFHDYSPDLPFLRQTPRAFRRPVVRSLYGWIKALQYSREHDIIMMRHMTFDPFSFLFAPLMKKRASVHHAKEVEELRIIKRDWRGVLASRLEEFSGPFALRRACAIVGVTKEIADYESERSNSASPTLFYPNGIDTERVSPLQDKRSVKCINIAFTCGTFARWHGLDKLISAVNYADSEDLISVENIHLIGKIPAEYVGEILGDVRLRQVFVLHGFMEESEYRTVLDRCDIGLSSFALERERLTEACTLKVREMLAMGLPVYSGHKDAALPADFPFYRNEVSISIKNMVDFGFIMKAKSRDVVAATAKPFINKRNIMESLVRAFAALR